MTGTPKHPVLPQNPDHAVRPIVALNATTQSGALDFRSYTKGQFHLPADFNEDAITYEAAEAPDGTFAPARKGDGTIDLGFTAHNAPAWYSIPDELSGAGALKIVTNRAVTDDRDIIFSLKAGG